MPNELETYRLYCSLKAHFSQEKYDFHKYRGRVRVSLDALYKRSDAKMFFKLGKKYSSAKLEEMFMSNLVHNPNLWIGEFLLDDKADEIYTHWKGIMEKFTYHFSEECHNLLSWAEKNGKSFNELFIVKGSDHPIIVKMALQKVISLETFVVLDMLLKFGKRIDKKIDDPIWKSLYLKMRKYSSFLNVDVGRCRVCLKSLLDTEFKSLIHHKEIS